MTTITTRAMPSSRLRTLGLVTVVAGLIGAACAVAIIAWPPQVSDDRYSCVWFLMFAALGVALVRADS